MTTVDASDGLMVHALIADRMSGDESGGGDEEAPLVSFSQLSLQRREMYEIRYKTSNQMVRE